MQSKKQSMFESITNVGIGYIVSLLTASIVFPLFNTQTSFVDNMEIAACFTVVSIIRTYLVRRWYTKHTK